MCKCALLSKSLEKPNVACDVSCVIVPHSVSGSVFGEMYVLCKFTCEGDFSSSAPCSRQSAYTGWTPGVLYNSAFKLYDTICPWYFQLFPEVNRVKPDQAISSNPDQQHYWGRESEQREMFERRRTNDKGRKIHSIEKLGPDRFWPIPGKRWLTPQVGALSQTGHHESKGLLKQPFDVRLDRPSKEKKEKRTDFEPLPARPCAAR